MDDVIEAEPPMEAYDLSWTSHEVHEGTLRIFEGCGECERYCSDQFSGVVINEVDFITYRSIHPEYIVLIT